MESTDQIVFFDEKDRGGDEKETSHVSGVKGRTLGPLRVESSPTHRPLGSSTDRHEIFGGRANLKVTV